jgi:hypothetical protein
MIAMLNKKFRNQCDQYMKKVIADRLASKYNSVIEAEFYIDDLILKSES